MGRERARERDSELDRARDTFSLSADQAVRKKVGRRDKLANVDNVKMSNVEE